MERRSFANWACMSNGCKWFKEGCLHGSRASRGFYGFENAAAASRRTVWSAEHTLPPLRLAMRVPEAQAKPQLCQDKAYWAKQTVRETGGSPWCPSDRSRCSKTCRRRTMDCPKMSHNALPLSVNGSQRSWAYLDTHQMVSSP